MCVLSCFRLFADPWTVARQAPLSMGYPMQEYWSGLPFPSPEDFPDPGIKPESLASPALAGGFFTTTATWEAQSCYVRCSVAQSCPTVRNPVDCSTPGFLVLHHLPGIAIEVSNFNSGFLFFWPQGMWDLRDRTHTSCIGSTES